MTEKKQTPKTEKTTAKRPRRSRATTAKKTSGKADDDATKVADVTADQSLVSAEASPSPTQKTPADAQGDKPAQEGETRRRRASRSRGRSRAAQTEAPATAEFSGPAADLKQPPSVASKLASVEADASVGSRPPVPAAPRVPSPPVPVVQAPRPTPSAPQFQHRPKDDLPFGFGLLDTEPEEPAEPPAVVRTPTAGPSAAPPAVQVRRPDPREPQQFRADFSGAPQGQRHVPPPQQRPTPPDRPHQPQPQQPQRPNQSHQASRPAPQGQPPRPAAPQQPQRPPQQGQAARPEQNGDHPTDNGVQQEGGTRRKRSRGRRRGRRNKQNGVENGGAPLAEGVGAPAPQGDRPRQGQPPQPRQALPAPSPVPLTDEDEMDELQDQDLPIERKAVFASPAPIQANERVMLINVAEGEECRIAIVHQKRLEELFIERASSESHVGNIYKGRVTNVEPSIQAAFVDFGLARNGFLHISDLQPQYFPGGTRQAEEVGRKTPRRERPPIQKCLRRGQEIIVQVIKEGIGTKGPTLTTYVSIPGRYLVMMPGMNRMGVSRRIEDEETRRKMRRILDDLNLPTDMGFILRTAGLERTKRELQRDLTYLQRLWKTVAERIRGERTPCELYQESDLVIRTIRDVYTTEFNRIIIDSPDVAAKVRDFLDIAMPRHSTPVEVWAEQEPLFHKFDLEAEIEQLHSRHVPLPSGGSLVIDSTEAMVAIDVNSGRFREHSDAEETAFRINMEAAEEIARQLRLRDLGGLILCDFVDMRADKHNREVERTLREALKKHKERAKCLRMSQFGIIEMTRQRMRPSIKRSIYQDCPYCHGMGLIKSQESMTLAIIRLLRLATHHAQVERVTVRVAPPVASQLLNHKRLVLHQMEEQAGVRILIESDRHLGLDQYQFECLDHRGGIIKVVETPEPRSAQPRYRGRAAALPAEEDERAEVRETFQDMID